ncbi:hypothetical protein Srubr_62740 [Streptomyces rubradiris]|uniref:Secreted protein n=1 Tax=Streptomyces rubradiris TaxID=285531 RepID=A0ABQ3RKN1_STRRR|nr:hypothetical protein GCM10018792_36050 [Streptomyces rubradiris]GHI56428.1 hypothetical protein Srubr_62740 [Streptomyces rubradiris]
MWVAFSAMHSAAWSGKWMFSSAGASVPGVSWKTMRMPSTVSVCPVRVMSAVGGIRPTAPVDVVCPRPAPICPRPPFGRAAPYM